LPPVSYATGCINNTEEKYIVQNIEMHSISSQKKIKKSDLSEKLKSKSEEVLSFENNQIKTIIVLKTIIVHRILCDSLQITVQQIQIFSSCNAISISNNCLWSNFV